MKTEKDFLVTGKKAARYSRDTNEKHQRINSLTVVIIAVCTVVLGVNILVQQKPDGTSFIEVTTKTETREAYSENIGYFEPPPKGTDDDTLPAASAETPPEAPVEGSALQAEKLTEIELHTSLTITETSEPQTDDYESAVLPALTTAIQAPSFSIPQTTLTENMSYEAPAEPQASSETYILNTNTKKFHYSDCSSVSRMSDKNKAYTDDRDYAVSEGYSPCAICNP